MKLLTIILALTSCCILANTASISRTSHSPEEDNIQLSSLTDAQREKLRTHFLQLIGVSIPDHSSTAASNISSQLNGRRAPLPLFDSSSTTSAHQNHKRSKREAHELPAHAHYLAALPAHQFGDLRLPSGRSLGPVSAVRIHASRDASKVRRFADGSVGLIISFAVPSHSEPIAHSELRFSHHQSPISSINQPIIIELYDYSLPNSLLDRKQVLPDTDGRHTKSLNASAFDISRAIKRAHRTGAASVNLMLKFVPAIQSASFGGGRRVRRDTATAAATVRNEQTLQALDAHMFTYVKDTERRSSSQVESSSPSQRRTRRSADPEEIGGVFNKLFSSRSKRHRFQRGRRQQTDSLAAIGGHNANVRGRYGNDVESNCKRRYMFVNFTELGLSQVILAPDGYVAWFCKGPCMHPLGAHMNATTHATLQSLMHLMQPGLVPSPCCSPTSLSGLSMLVKSHEDDTFTVKVLKDMVVDSCGCR